MKEKLAQLRSNWTTFTNTPYYDDFQKTLWKYLLSLLFLVMVLIFAIMERHRISDFPVMFWGCFIAFIIFYMVFSIHIWIQYCSSMIFLALRIEELKGKYALVDMDKMTTYSSSLHAILSLIDSSLDREYSNRILQKQAELDAMKSQINPHFLYNTLDTIRGYAMMENAPLTSDMIEVLSRLFRYSISQKNALVTFRQELSVLYDYIKIQEYRINQHIIFVQNIDSDLNIMDYKIPRLIIQPFIENAIKHGLNGIQKELIITLHIYRTQSRLIVSISDNGSGMTTEQLRTLNQKLASGTSDSVHSDTDSSKKRGSGIALSNVNARIKLVFGESYGVTAYSILGNGSEFQISLPYYDET